MIGHSPGIDTVDVRGTAFSGAILRAPMIAYHVTHIASQVRRMRTMTASSSNSKSSPTTPSRAPAARWTRRSNHRRRARIGLRVHGRGGRVGRAPLRRALPMTGARLTAALECANDAGGRCALWLSGDAHACYGVSRDTATSCAYAARPASAAGAALAVVGATPQSEGLVRARGRVCFHTLGPCPPGVAPGPGIPCGKANATAVLAALANEVALRASMAVLRAGQESRPMCRGFLVTPAWSLALHSSPFAG